MPYTMSQEEFNKLLQPTTPKESGTFSSYQPKTQPVNRYK